MLKGPIARRSPTSSPAGARVPARRARSKPDGLGAEPPPRERERLRGGGVEPLHVVDRDQHRALGCQPAQQPEQCHAECALVARGGARALEQQRDTQRLGLRSRERVDCIVERPCEEVAEPGECELCLSFRRPALQHPVGAPLRLLDGCKPERRLADACLAFQLERRGLAGRDEDRKRSQLSRSRPTTPDAVRVAMAICRDRTERPPAATS